LFTSMLDSIKYEFLVLLLKFPSNMISDRHIKPIFSKNKLVYSNTNNINVKQNKSRYIRKYGKIGRNDICYCGSGV